MADTKTLKSSNVVQDVNYSKGPRHTPESGSPYDIGDVYESLPSPVLQGWGINTSDLPYLAYIKSLSKAWPSLRYLAEFMEVSTIPLRWKFLRHNHAERLERSERTNVTVLDFSASGQVVQKPVVFTKSDDLELLLSQKADSNPPTRLFLVEDLSRQTIEMLGSRFDIDPTFFRQHIDDYSWYNVRDRWMIPQSLTTTIRHRKWFRLRHVRARYFRTTESFQTAREESNVFNVLRRPDDDQNCWTPLDERGSVVSLTRTRTSIWIGNDEPNGMKVGIILVDPTIREGLPLWYGYCNWAPIPGITSSSPPSGPPRTSLYQDLIHWTLEYPWFDSTHTVSSSQDLQVLIQPSLHIISAEWLIICDYIKTRLGQIEWEIGFPEQFPSDDEAINKSLKRLHTWRRVIPVYRELVSETLTYALPQASKLSMLQHNPTNTRIASPGSGTGAQSIKPFDDIWTDFESILDNLKELQARTDRLTSVITAAIGISDSRRGLEESRNLARLTWLATTFIPMTFFTGFFSMQPDLGSLRDSFRWYFAIALPFTTITVIALATNVWYRSLRQRNRDRKNK